MSPSKIIPAACCSLGAWLGADAGALRRWTSRGLWAVTDQALFAGTNFLVSIVLGRWLEPKEYGAFATAYSVFLFAGSVHTGLLTEPMMVFGAKRYRRCFPEYLCSLLKGHCVLTAIFSMWLAAAAFIAVREGAETLAHGLAGMSLALPFVLLAWLTRRACYVLMRPGWAAGGSAVYAVLLPFVLWLLGCAGLLTVFSAVLAMGGTGMVAQIGVLVLLGPVSLSRPMKGMATARIAHLHIAYGRWAVASTVLLWVSSNVPYVVLPMSHGLATTAKLRAAMNFVLPFQHAAGAMLLVILPKVAALPAAVHRKMLIRRVAALCSLFVLCGVGYAVVLLGFRRQLAEIAYGGRYPQLPELVPYTVFLLLTTGVVGPAGMALRGTNRPECVCRSYFWAAVASVTVGAFLILWWGVEGAVTSMAISASIAGVLMVRQLMRTNTGGKAACE